MWQWDHQHTENYGDFLTVVSVTLPFFHWNVLLSIFPVFQCIVCLAVYIRWHLPLLLTSSCTHGSHIQVNLFSLSLCPRCIVTPLVSLKLIFFFPFPLPSTDPLPSDQMKNGQDVICRFRGFASPAEHCIKKHLKFKSKSPLWTKKLC